MVFRQTRLIARLVCAAILLIALAALVFLGPEATVQIGSRSAREGGRVFPLSEAGLIYSAYGLVWYFAHAQAARVKRWRRNILKAGGVFATSWIGSLVLLLALESMGFAAAAGYAVNRKAGYAAVIGILVLVRANQLPKSRPGWFNGIAFPVFASHDDVWRRVHKASALRLLAIGLTGIGLAALAPADMDPIRPLMLLLLLELAIATIHALWLGVRRREGNISLSGGGYHDLEYLEEKRRSGRRTACAVPDREHPAGGDEPA